METATGPATSAAPGPPTATPDGAILAGVEPAGLSAVGVFEAGPRLRPHINVFVAGEPGDLSTPVGSNDTVHVIPAVSGG